MLTKSDIILQLKESGCQIDYKQLAKMKKTELETILLNYQPKPQVKTSKRPRHNRSFSSSEDEDEYIIETLDLPDPEPEPEPEPEPVQEPVKVAQVKVAQVKEKPVKNLKARIKEKVKCFINHVDLAINDFKNDRDVDYLVDNYNVLYRDTEDDLKSLLEESNANDNDYNYTDSLLQIQNKRIERIVKSK